MWINVNTSLRGAIGQGHTTIRWRSQHQNSQTNVFVFKYFTLLTSDNFERFKFYYRIDLLHKIDNLRFLFCILLCFQ